MEAIHDVMDKEIGHAPTAKAALDIACYDAAGKSLGIPAYELLGGRYHDEFILTHVLSIQEPDVMAQEAVDKLKDGYTSFKMKVGFNMREDVKRIQAVRKAVGPDIAIRVDVNQGWENSATAIQALKLVEDCYLDWIEQPIIADDIDGIVEIKQKTSIPVMIDEGLGGFKEMRTIIDKQAAHKVNIKLMKCGGMYPANKLAIMAEMANIDCQVGSMVESSVGSAAGYHVAFSKKSITSTELTGPLMYSEDIGNLGYDLPYIRISDQPGLGIDVDEETLEKLTVKSGVVTA